MSFYLTLFTIIICSKFKYLISSVLINKKYQNLTNFNYYINVKVKALLMLATMIFY